jgi:ribosomal protein L7/L12
VEPDVIWVVAAAISFVTLCGIALWRNRSSVTGEASAVHPPLPALEQGVRLLGDAEPNIQALLQQRRVIDAIKLYRESTGASLLEAKQAIDRLRKPK